LRFALGEQMQPFARASGLPGGGSGSASLLVIEQPVRAQRCVAIDDFPH
jgi:hypothetical protein